MKKFAGFTPQQEFVLLRKMGYKGGQNKAEMDKFLKASPAAAAKLGSYSRMAEDRLAGKTPNKKPMAMATGGLVDPAAYLAKNPDLADAGITTPEAAQKHYQQYGQYENRPGAPKTAASNLQTDVYLANNPDLAKEGITTPEAARKHFQTYGQYENRKGTPTPTGEALAKMSTSMPQNIVTPANVAEITASPDQSIADGTGQAAPIEEKPTETVDQVETATAAPKTEAAQVEAVKTQEDVEKVLADTEAATAQPTAQATVRGQLAELMQDFENDGTPPWASGAMRAAMGAMQKRGLGASSMAGQAVVQAAMESAIGIASQDAQTFAQFEMQNLNNEQQTRIFKTQQRIASLFSDQAAENAAQQFNASSKNQTDQFFAELETTVSRFNADSVNSIRQFNAGEKNTANKFYSQLKAQRDQFNAQNDLIIAQANAQWRQQIATANAAAQNEANLQNAMQANGMTQRGMDQVWQRERDLMNFAFVQSESAQDRSLQLLLADKNIAQSNNEMDRAESNSKRQALGYISASLLGGLF